MSAEGSARDAPREGERLNSPPSPRRRDHAPAWLSSSVWSQGGESYCDLYSQNTGSPGQDLGRFTEGPARYLNGTPNVGSKAMLERNVQLSPRGRFLQGKGSGPAQHTELVMDRKLACKRSSVGPDPYGLSNANMWTPRTPQRAYAVIAPADGSMRQPWVYGRTATHAFDPCTRPALLAAMCYTFQARPLTRPTTRVRRPREQPQRLASHLPVHQVHHGATDAADTTRLLSVAIWLPESRAAHASASLLAHAVTLVQPGWGRHAARAALASDDLAQEWKPLPLIPSARQGGRHTILLRAGVCGCASGWVAPYCAGPCRPVTLSLVCATYVVRVEGETDAGSVDLDVWCNPLQNKSSLMFVKSWALFA